MSLNHLATNTQANTYLNSRLNSLVVNENVSSSSLNLNNGPITNVASINGVPLSPFVTDANPVNIIYRPGETNIPIGSNVVSSWSEVIAKASKINVNEILNVYIDDSIISPAPLDVNHDFKGQCALGSYNTNVSTNVQAIIPNGTLISNLGGIGIVGKTSTLKLICDSQTGPSLSFSSGSVLTISYGSIIQMGPSSTQSAIQLNNSAMIISIAFGGGLNNNGPVRVISMTNSQLIYPIQVSPQNISDVIEGDIASSLTVFYDSTINKLTTTFPAFLGSINYFNSAYSSSVSYDDSLVNPPLGSSNVQGAIDSLKSNVPSTKAIYLASASGNQSVNNNTTTTINIWDTVISSLSTTQLNGYVTVNNTGTYVVNVNLSFAFLSASAEYSMWVVKNNTTDPPRLAQMSNIANLNTASRMCISYVGNFSANDTISIFVRHDDLTGAINIGTLDATNTAFLSIYQLS